MRSRLLQCRCGADLSEATTENATPETLELLNVVLAVFNNSGLIASESMTGMPFDALTNMALNTLIALIRSTGASKRLVDQSRYYRNTIDHNSEIAAAAAVFTNWPHHYHEFLGEHESYLLQRYTINNYDWPNSYEKLFNTPYPENEIKFLKKEYIEFIQKYWWLSQRAKKSAHVPRSYRHRYVATNIYAHLIGALPSTVKSMIISDELLLISTLYQDIKSGERFKEIKNHQLPADCSQVLSSSEASNYLDLPSIVLSGLRQTGYYLENHTCPGKLTFHREDLAKFRAAFLSRQLKINNKKQEMTSIRHAMAIKSKASRFKLELIIKIITGGVKCYGTFSSIAEIQIATDDLNEIRHNVSVSEPICYLRHSQNMVCINQDMLSLIHKNILIHLKDTYASLSVSQK